VNAPVTLAAQRTATTTVFGRPLPVALIAGEKAVSALGVAAGSGLAWVLLARGRTNVLRVLWPREWAEDPQDHWMAWLTRHVPELHPGLTAAIAAVLALWALLLGAEAVGLWMDLGWGDLLILVETGCLLPLEAWHLARRPTGDAALALGCNLLIAGYVAWRLRQRARARAARAG